MTPPPPFVFGSGDTFADVRDCIPARLLALAAKSAALLGIDSSVVAVAGLAHFAASLGRLCFLDDGFSQFPACFSVAVLSDSLLPFDWITLLGRGWVDEATSVQNLDSDQVRAVIKNAVRKAGTKGPDRGSIDPQFQAYADTLPLTIVNMMRRRTILSKVDPNAAARAVVDSRDRCAVMMNGADDPMAEWAHLPPSKQQKLTEMLKLSGQGKALTITSKGTEVLGTLHALWLTRRESVRKALFDRRSASINRSAPVLLFQQHGNPKRFPDVEAAEFQEWSKCLKMAFDHRRNASPEDSSTIVINKPARQIAEEFYEQFANALSRVPASLHPYLSWLPDLPLRLLNVLVVSKAIEKMLDMKPTGSAQEPPKPDPNELPATMRQAVRLTRWLCQEHHRVVFKCMGVAATDNEEHATDSTDMVNLEEVILAKLKDKGPQAPRKLQRSFHDLSARDRDRAVASLKKACRVVEMEDGRLAAAA